MRVEIGEEPAELSAGWITSIIVEIEGIRKKRADSIAA